MYAYQLTWNKKIELSQLSPITISVEMIVFVLPPCEVTFTGRFSCSGEVGGYSILFGVIFSDISLGQKFFLDFLEPVKQMSTFMQTTVVARTKLCALILVLACHPWPT